MARLSMPPKQDYPPLLPKGLHPKTLHNIRELCVDEFPESNTRLRLMNGLRELVRLISEVGIRADLWICGSFVTRKLNPKDIDIVLDIGNQIRFTDEQKKFIRWFHSKDPIQERHMLDKFGCDCYVSSTEDHEQWLNTFGKDRKGNPKGIIVVAINGGAL